MMACLWASLCFGQPEIAANAETLPAQPELIAFDEWTQVESTEFFERYALSFPSALPSGVKENDTVPCIFTVPANRNGAVPVVFLFHYWGATDLILEQRTANELANKGMASVIMQLPYHLSRSPRGTRSGELAIVPNVAVMKGMMLQALQDVRRLKQFVAQRPEFDSQNLGLMGTSLGSLIGSLAYAVEPEFKCGAFFLGGCDFAGIMWNSSKTVATKNALRQQGYTEEKLREEFKLIEPLGYLKLAGTRPAFVVRARYDTIIPTRNTDQLIEALGSPYVVTLETGHYGGAVVQQTLLRSVAQYFASSLHGQPFTAPKNVFAPTVRVGLLSTGDEPVSFFGGVDLWKSYGNYSVMTSLIATPKGPALFGGFQIGSNTAVGGVVTPKRVTWGLMWNVIL